MSEKKREEEAKLWKDYLNKKAVEEIAAAIKKHHATFDSKRFVKLVTADKFTSLELKARIERIADCLHEVLPGNYRKQIKILGGAAPHLKDFANWALMTIIEKYGLDHFDDSIKAMETLTKYSTAEFAIRPYVINYTEKMIPILKQWATSEDFHVRRLAAEAARPRGVWVKHVEPFMKKPQMILPVLETLKADDSLYVRKAVANCINDITKDNPDVVIKLSEKWLSAKKVHKHTEWIVKQGLRSLIKEGHPKVFPLLGFEKNAKTKVSNLKWSKKVIKVGTDESFSLTLSSDKKKPQKLAVDYAVHYVKKNGKTSPKVFKLTEKILSPDKPLQLKSKHSFREMTTRKHYAGMHKLDIIVNGITVSSVEFNLVN